MTIDWKAMSLDDIKKERPDLLDEHKAELEDNKEPDPEKKEPAAEGTKPEDEKKDQAQANAATVAATTAAQANAEPAASFKQLMSAFGKADKEYALNVVIDAQEAGLTMTAATAMFAERMADRIKAGGDASATYSPPPQSRGGKPSPAKAYWAKVREYKAANKCTIEVAQYQVSQNDRELHNQWAAADCPDENAV